LANKTATDVPLPSSSSSFSTTVNIRRSTFSVIRGLLLARFVRQDIVTHVSGVLAAGSVSAGSPAIECADQSFTQARSFATNSFQHIRRKHSKANPFDMNESINVFGEKLEQCGTEPVTGFFRDNYCNTATNDFGSHTVAAIVNDKWLNFSAARGNDLRGFLTGGCRWCLCASRWKESFDAYKRGELDRDGVPQVILASTHKVSLNKIDLKDLQAFSHERPALSSIHPAQGGPIR
jgi:hypothetical protein